MGLFRWLTAILRPGSRRLPWPNILSGLENDATQVVFETGGAIHIMDRDHFDYSCGNSKAPEPAQDDLNDLLPSVSRVRAFAAGMCRGRPTSSEVVLDTSDTDALETFRELMSIDEDPATFDHCACAGGPTLELFDGKEVAATIGVQHGRSIRWNRWKHDARLRDGAALVRWLTRHGIETELLDRLLYNQFGQSSFQTPGFRRSGSVPLTRAEQQIRLIEIARIRGGDIDRALAGCQRVLDADPNVGMAFAVRAFIHSQRGNNAQCLADCNEALRLGLYEAEVFFARAVAHDHEGATEKALADCTKALELDPTHANALNSRGVIRSRHGLVSDALSDFGAAIRFAPDWYLPYLNRSQTHLDRNDSEAVFADANRVIELMDCSNSPENRRIASVAYANRGRAHQISGDEELARLDFVEAERLAANRPKPKDTAHCSYCKGTGECYCERTGMPESEECVICHGTRQCPLCHPAVLPD